MKTYFDLLVNDLKQYNLLDRLSCVFNMDETKIQLNNNPSAMITKNGSKTVCAITFSEKSETISQLACCNAEGMSLSLVAIMKRKNKKRVP